MSPWASADFILFRTGFFGAGITSTVPPFSVIFADADAEK